MNKVPGKLGVCARDINMKNVELDVLVEEQNINLKSSTGTIEFMLLKFITFFQKGVDPDPCTTHVQADPPSFTHNGAGRKMILTIEPSQAALHEELRRMKERLQKSGGGSDFRFIPPVNPTRLQLEAVLYNTSRLDSDNKVIRITVEDPDHARFKVPLATEESLLSISTENIESSGFTLSHEPFYFSVKDKGQTDYISTKN